MQWGDIMKILYKQPESLAGSLLRFGVSNCYLKDILLCRDETRMTKKQHQHTGLEMHIIKSGCQEYVVGGKEYRLESGNFLLIYPKVSHQVIASTPNTQKYAITFNMTIADGPDCLFGSLTPRVADNIERIVHEVALKKAISNTLIENTLLEIIVWVLRLAGIKEEKQKCQPEENAQITFAKQFIDDNIAQDPSVSDVAVCCHISSKQLTRIFQKAEGVSPGEYIIRKRVERIESLLAEGSLSLRQISEDMQFSSEHYFNAFFKKYAGMTPGAYRRMHGN